MSHDRCRFSIISLSFIFLIFVGQSHAQTRLSDEIKSPELVHPLESADTSSPRATLVTFIENITLAYKLFRSAEDLGKIETGFFYSDAVTKKIEQARIKGEIAIQTLDLSKVLPSQLEDVRIESILMLKEILDRIELPPAETIPDIQAVKEEKISKWTIPHTEITIIRVQEGPRSGEFLFSSETVSRLPQYYRRVQQLPYRVTNTKEMYSNYISTAGRLLTPRWLFWVDYLPSWTKRLYHEQTIWQWIALSVILVVALIVPFAARKYIRRRFRNVSYVTKKWRHLIVPIISLGSLTFALYFIDEQIHITGGVLLFVELFLKTITILVIVWIIYVAARAIAANIIASPRINPNGLNASLIRVSANIIGALLGLGFFLWGVERLGVPLAPLLGGLGLGGLAMALAIRPTLENFIGGLTLYLDKPIRVGDFCRFDDKMGEVEHIGLRSTRVRAFDRTVTSIPNSEFSNMQLTNISYRDKRLIRETVGLRYETSPEQLRFVMAKIRELLIRHPKSEEEPLPTRVRLVGFGASSFDLEIFAYVATRNLNEFLAIREDIFLRIIDILSEAGTGFAFPSMTTYLTRDGGLNLDRKLAAEKEVRDWRENDRLPYPNFEQVQLDRLNNTLDYPPLGSVDSENKKSNSRN